MLRILLVIIVQTVILTSVMAQTSKSPFQKARKLAFNKQYDESIKICDSILAENVDNYDVESLLARVYSWKGDLDIADSLGEAMNLKYPDSKEVYLMWGTFNTWKADHNKGVSIYSSGLAKFPEDPDLMLALANGLGAINEPIKGLEICDAVVDTVPWIGKAIMLRINLLSINNQNDSVIALCDSLIPDGKNEIKLRLIRAQAKAKIKLYDLSRQDLDTIFKYDKKHIGAHYALVNTYLWEPINDSAIWSADSALQFYPDNNTFKVMLAKANLRRDSLEICDSIIATVLKEDSLNYGAWSVCLNSRLAQSDFDSVEYSTEMLDTIYPNDDEFRRLRVLALSGNEKYKEAIKVMDDGIEDLDSLDENSQILYTKLHFWDGQNSKALKLVDRFIELNPESIGLLTIKSIILKNRFQKSAALETIDEGLEIDSTNTDLIELRKEVEKINLNELGGYLTYDFYSNTTKESENRKAITIEYMRRIQRHVFVARLTVANRFDSTGLQGEIDAYPTITDWLYVYANIGVSNRWLFPEFRAGLEPFVALPYNLEASLGIRYMQYPGNNLLIWTGSISAYPGKFYLSARPYLTFNNNGTNQSYNFKVRRFFTRPKTYVELSGGFGSSPDNSYLDQSLNQLVDSRSWNIGVTYQQQLGEQFYGKAFVIFDQYYPEQIPNFNIVSCNLGLYWMF
ncbi:MAG: YaiO family outer membrane beta-barrel protein [Salibacteraceae bacterium]